MVPELLSSLNKAWHVLEPWIPFMLGTSMILILLSIVAIPVLLVRLPADYFTTRRKPPVKRGIVAMAIFLLRNILATLLILTGLLMFLLPGPGLLVLLVGIATSTFAGKYYLERAIVRYRPVYDAVNWVRKSRGQPPILYPTRRGRQAPERDHE